MAHAGGEGGFEAQALLVGVGEEVHARMITPGRGRGKEEKWGKKRNEKTMRNDYGRSSPGDVGQGVVGGDDGG